MKEDQVYVIKYNIEGTRPRGEMIEYYSQINKVKFIKRYLDLKNREHVNNIRTLHGKLQSIDMGTIEV